MTKKCIAIHPFLFSIYPLLFLYTINNDELELSHITLPLTVILVCTFLTVYLLRFIIKNTNKTGIIVSIFSLLFFSYGASFRFLSLTGWWNSNILCHVWLISVTFVLFSYTVFRILKTPDNLIRHTVVLNVIGIVLISGSLFNIGAAQISQFGKENAIKKRLIPSLKPINQDMVLPDIYYIILDSYARADILGDLYAYDNSNFLDYIRQKGFYVANKSNSNYGRTYLSLASSFNMEYLDDLIEGFSEGSSDSHQQIYYLLGHNRLISTLKKYGYKTISFSSGCSLAKLKNADTYMVKKFSWDEFTNELLYLTPLPYVLGIMANLNPSLKKFLKIHPYVMYKTKIVYIFDHLSDFTGIKTPIFVFAHILPPHQPFVFGRDHSEIDFSMKLSIREINAREIDGKKYGKYYKQQYIKQLEYVNIKIRKSIDNILSKTERPTVIILQADHGPPSFKERAERLAILNAYYFYDRNYEKLYPEITPVNTFRVILNKYFGGDFKLLPDRSYL